MKSSAICDEMLGLRARHENTFPHSHDDITEGGVAGEVLRRISIGQLPGCTLCHYLHAILTGQSRAGQADLNGSILWSAATTYCKFTTLRRREQRALLSMSKYLSQVNRRLSCKNGRLKSPLPECPMKSVDSLDRGFLP